MADIQYVLIAQGQNEYVVIGIKNSPYHMIRSASEILANKNLLQHFSPQDAAMLGFIAGMAVYEND